VTSKKIMIFGGMIEYTDGVDSDKDTMVDNSQTVMVSKLSYYLDVTKGSIKRGPDLSTPCYYVNNGGNLLCMHNKLYAQGFGINYDVAKSPTANATTTSDQKDTKPPVQSSAATSGGSRDATTTYHHKKILHCYNQTD